MSISINKRKFFKSLGALAVGCMIAGGLSWRSLKTESIETIRCIVNPEWINARYEINLSSLLYAGKQFPDGFWPVRSNNPNAIRDNDFIPPFTTIDA